MNNKAEYERLVFKEALLTAAIDDITMLSEGFESDAETVPENLSKMVFKNYDRQTRTRIYIKTAKVLSKIAMVFVTIAVIGYLTYVNVSAFREFINEIIQEWDGEIFSFTSGETPITMAQDTGHYDLYKPLYVPAKFNYTEILNNNIKSHFLYEDDQGNQISFNRSTLDNSNIFLSGNDEGIRKIKINDYEISYIVLNKEVDYYNLFWTKGSYFYKLESNYDFEELIKMVQSIEYGN
ncbi:MAG: DUF4367 domain-containing protein [Clostridiales bacterium]|nr:DUF4367 domain-containing protein [Clostridiales bacterium]